MVEKEKKNDISDSGKYKSLFIECKRGNKEGCVVAEKYLDN